MFGTRIVLRKRLIITHPGVPLPLPHTPKKKINNLPKNVSPSTFPVLCPRDRFHRESPSVNPVQRTSGKGSTPRTSKWSCVERSRTRFSSPLVIAREQRRTRSNNLPRRNSTTKCVRAMDQDYPPTGPSPGTNPPTYPSSLPRTLGKLSGNIPSWGHWFFFLFSLSVGVMKD
jgi:hypothetical protein